MTAAGKPLGHERPGSEEKTASPSPNTDCHAVASGGNGTKSPTTTSRRQIRRAGKSDLKRMTASSVPAGNTTKIVNPARVREERARVVKRLVSRHADHASLPL